jgi:hypothetical protein
VMTCHHTVGEMLRTAEAVHDMMCHVNGVLLTCRFYWYMMYCRFHCSDQLHRQFKGALKVFSLSLAYISGGRYKERCLDSD